MVGGRAAPVLRASCFNRLTCVRALLDNRLVWPILFAICVYSLFMVDFGHFRLPGRPIP
jgi:hypothetical protein